MLTNKEVEQLMNALGVSYIINLSGSAYMPVDSVLQLLKGYTENKININWLTTTKFTY